MEVQTFCCPSAVIEDAALRATSGEIVARHVGAADLRATEKAELLEALKKDMVISYLYRIRIKRSRDN